MTLADYERDMAGCSRCTCCKWSALSQIKSWRYAKNCPSVTKYNFHAYSGGGRLTAGLSIIKGRSELTEGVADIVYKCQLCGACDTACKIYRDDIDINEVLLEFRADCVERGQLVLEHMLMIDALKKEDNVLGEPKAARDKWAEGLGLKDVNKQRADVLLHAGCRYCYDKDLWPSIRAAVRLILSAGINLGFAGKNESCCGGRAYELGYRGEAEKYADDMLSRVKASGAITLLTCCADGYSHFRYLYPRMGRKLSVDVVHITEYLIRLIQAGRIRFQRKVPLKVTYHDPCHLGRMSEPFIPEWEGDKLLRPSSLKRAGRGGVYEQPRAALRSIPGLELVEMERIREWSWCCGAGGGVYEAYPDFCFWTAMERIDEARSAGAEALVTACPWCVRAFRDALEQAGEAFPIYDMMELVAKSIGIPEEEV